MFKNVHNSHSTQKNVLLTFFHIFFIYYSLSFIDQIFQNFYLFLNLLTQFIELLLKHDASMINQKVAPISWTPFMAACSTSDDNVDLIKLLKKTR